MFKPVQPKKKSSPPAGTGRQLRKVRSAQKAVRQGVYGKTSKPAAAKKRTSYVPKRKPLTTSRRTTAARKAALSGLKRTANRTPLTRRRTTATRVK